MKKYLKDFIEWFENKKGQIVSTSRTCKLWLNYIMYVEMLWVIHLWRPLKMTNFWPLYPHHPQKWIINLLFKNNRIRKQVTNFKTPPPPFRVDVINVWSLAVVYSSRIDAWLVITFIFKKANAKYICCRKPQQLRENISPLCSISYEFRMWYTVQRTEKLFSGI